MPAHSTRRPLDARITTSGLVVLLAVCATGNVRSQCPDGTPPPCAGRPARLAAPPANSVAVMYLDNESRDTSDAYLADGLTEEITTKLGQIGRLAVTSNTTMRRYRGPAALEPTALGRALRVAQLVSGSVRRAGHRIRVNVELLRARDGVQLWADAYDQTDADLLAIEETIARSVATAIAGRLLPGEQASLAARPTQNPEAYDHLLRGNFSIAQRTPAAARRALAEYQAAAALDPAFALAYGRIGLCYALFIDWGWPYPGLTEDSLLVLGSSAADRALQLDSQSTDGWMARAYMDVYLHPTTFEGALPAFERAIALDPKNAEAHHQYASILMSMGRDRAAAVEYRRALALDPLRAITLDNFGGMRYLEHRTEEAAGLLDSSIAADPQAYYAYVDRADLRLTGGDVGGARADVAASVRTRPGDYIVSSEPLVATLEGLSGDTAAARARLARVTAGLPNPEHPDYTAAQWIALAYLRIGDRERALSVLESVRPRGINLWFIMRDPGFDPIRETPRFRALVERTRPPAAP
ncbi:MAG TPA: tetratricopeptide repeat protein [Gemmatimonadales bacterium]|nr:tetratricopeptide repeat protein [Gemmatimonadales bacterium]